MSLFDLIRICIIPALFIVCMTWLLRFPTRWVFRSVLAFEILLVLVLLIIEFNARSVAGTGGWMSFYALVLQFFILLSLVISRLALWLDHK